MRQMCIFFALIMEKTASGLDYHDWKFLKVREHVFVLIKGTSFFFINQFAQVLESHTWININEWSSKIYQFLQDYGLKTIQLH